MSHDNAYFQFPLPCLAYGADYKRRLQAIVDWCIMDRANHIAATTTKADLLVKIEDVTRESLPGEFNRNRVDHLAMAAARAMLRIKGGTVSGTTETAAAVTAHIAAMDRVHGPSPTVRIRNDLLWDCANGSMGYRDFSTLCAVYSVIGAKEYPVIITRKRIIAGQLGYKSPSLMTPEVLKLRCDGAVPLTEKQVRLTLDELEHRSLITRVQASARKVYFSNRMDRKEMSEKLIAVKVKRLTKVKKNRYDDRNIQSEIDATIKAVFLKSDGPRKDHAGATQGPHEGHDRDRFNINSLIQSSLKEPGLKEAGVISDTTPHSISLNRDTVKGIESLKRKIQSAIVLNTPESLQNAERYRKQLTELSKGEWI